ncbi:hypothetical protein COY33_00940 [candidate division WWE3 bacterium CG_4_10_14_0_2_um_filter_42_7]|uniref:Uncharacterized protein n=1 Tax=candidate division WWE3 bacterium CG_4_10_14_0_2_um_filter_42_7 TaxID=1975073 RepID=A0A2M7TDV8_UNCKA|nr:MAG: hypothetical protein COY33_00940 [candidate division WWE3 bacterium CG_4_10_14_0_2_um_filter_42_7]
MPKQPFRSPTPLFISFLQASGLVSYCLLIGTFVFNSEGIFGKMTNSAGPALFLILFVTSALISALIVLGYPIYIFFDKKQVGESLKLIGLTTFWLFFFVISFLSIFLIFK